MKKKLIPAVISVLSIIFILWIVWGNVTVGVTRCRVKSGRIPEGFDHYKIAVISDLHNARFGENNIKITSLIKKENPDIVAVTGDLIDAKKPDFETAVHLAQELVKIAPCYYVTGNHEANIRERYAELEKKLLEAGVIILHDSSETIMRNDERIQIAGLDDPYFTDSCLTVKERISAMNLTEDYTVLLSHRPENFSSYVSENIDLVLSGHSHGGQFRLPFIGGLAAPNQGFLPKYDAGEFTENNTTMIVSRGIGNSVIPIRFNNRPEIVIVELTG
jgi:predicted MPP superfamily phosphohydrolase